MGGTPRWSAHAAQQRSGSSLALGNACRSLVSQSAASGTRTMRLLHWFDVHLLDGPAALLANAGRSKRGACSSPMQPHRPLIFRLDPRPCVLIRPQPLALRGPAAPSPGGSGRPGPGPPGHWPGRGPRRREHPPPGAAAARPPAACPLRWQARRGCGAPPGARAAPAAGFPAAAGPQRTGVAAGAAGPAAPRSGRLGPLQPQAEGCAYARLAFTTAAGSMFSPLALRQGTFCCTWHWRTAACRPRSYGSCSNSQRSALRPGPVERSCGISPP